MSRYRKVWVQVWTDAKFRSLSQLEPSGQALWLYLISCPRRTNIPGIVVATPEVLAAELRWPLGERFANGSANGSSNPLGNGSGNGSGNRSRTLYGAMHEAIALGLVRADFDAGLVWMPRGTRYDPPANPNVVRSWAKTWPEVPECDLKDEIYLELKRYLKQFKEPLLEPFENGLRVHDRSMTLRTPDPESGARSLASATAQAGLVPEGGSQIALLPADPQSASAAQPAKKPRKSSREGGAKKPSGDHHDVVDFWATAYEERYFRPYVWSEGKDFALIARLLKTSPPDEVKARMRLLVEHPPKFLAGTPPDIGTLSQHWNKLVAVNGHDVERDRWTQLLNLGLEEQRMVEDGEVIPWLTDPRRWSMAKDRGGRPLRRVVAPGVFAADGDA